MTQLPLAPLGAGDTERLPSALSGLVGGIATAFTAPVTVIMSGWIIAAATTEETITSGAFDGALFVAMIGSMVILLPFGSVGLLLGMANQPTKMLWLSPGTFVALTLVLATQDHARNVMIYGIFGVVAGVLFVVYERLARFLRR